MHTTGATPERETNLRKGVRLLALGLEHSVLYSESYQGLNRVKEQTYTTVKRLNSKDLRIVSDALKEFEREYSLKGVDNNGISVMRNLLESRTLL